VLERNGPHVKRIAVERFYFQALVLLEHYHHPQLCF
jgi:hypothetical protein